jgi:hypothetical protein
VQAGDSLRFQFSALLFPPLTTEAWIRISSTSLTTSHILFYQGNNASNGAGLYLATNRHLHLLRGGSGDTDTGYVWPDTNWHMVDLVSNSAVSATVYVDGLSVGSFAIAAPLTPSPNGQGWLCDDSAFTCTLQSDISYPTFYFGSLDANRIYANFLAATDPDQALQRVQASTGAAVFSADLTQLLADLEAVLAAVIRPFPGHM